MFQFEFDNALLNVNNNLKNEIVRLISQNKNSISIAESNTAGLIFNVLASIDRLKMYCIGGVVCQHVRSYITLAGVSPTTYKNAGLKGSLVAIEMARGVRKKSQSDIGLGVYAMIMTTDAKNMVYHVFIALVNSKKTLQHHIVLDGSESEVKKQTVIESLVFLRDSLNSFRRVYD